MRYRRRPSPDDDPPTLVERLIMAILTPVMFNLSLLILVSSVFKRSWYMRRALLYPGAYTSVWLIALLLVGLPALLGFCLGAKRGATLLGHFFYTNMEHERSLQKTALAWASLFLISYLLAKLL